MLLGLRLLRDYDSQQALELLTKDEDDLLQLLLEGHPNLFEAASEDGVPTKPSYRLELHTISLIRAVLEFSEGKVDCRQHVFDQGYTSSDNASLYGRLLGVADNAGINPMEGFDPEQMCNTLLKSKAFAEGPDISLLEVIEWNTRIVDFLPIGFREEHLVRYSEKQT